MADAPPSCAARAHSTALTESKPARIFTVTGRPAAFRTAETILNISFGERINALPSPLAIIFLAGQPIFISIMGNELNALEAAAPASNSGSCPKI